MIIFIRKALQNVNFTIFYFVEYLIIGFIITLEIVPAYEVLKVVDSFHRILNP